ncbi:chromosome partitioning protein ParA [Clostridia bacterium]|nr:chromosome partitioning protein ParA [Clostridia bacterium]
MKILSIINLKGGVAKTVSAVNIAYGLAKTHNKRVLLVDNDKQGDTSKMFGVHSYDAPSTAEIMTRTCTITQAITPTRFELIDVLPANMNLLSANRQVLLDSTRPQQTRFKKAFEELGGKYDYCVIDNAPDINISVINALVASHDVLIPIKIDKFALDGLSELLDQIGACEEMNPNLRVAGCFVTCYRPTLANSQGAKWLREHAPAPIFNTNIRATTKIDESTFAGKPIFEYAPNSVAAQDYERLIKEYLQRGGENHG